MPTRMPHATDLMNQPRSFTFPRSHRLSGEKAFAAVFDNRLRKNAGPIAVCLRPNDQNHHRLGLSVPRRVGTAVRRNRIKRLLRDAYRLGQHDLPGSYDLVVVVRPHQPLTLEDYRRLLTTAVESAHRTAMRRKRNAAD